MIRPLPIACLADYAALFPGPHLAYVAASILAGNTEAQLWEIPQDDAPPLLLLWDQGNNIFYWAGPPDDMTGVPPAICVEALAAWVATTLRPQALALGAPYFRVAACSPALAPLLPALFAGVELHPYPIYLYIASAPPRPAAAPPGVTLVPITRALLARDDLDNTAEVCAEIHWMWPSLAAFEAAGFGVAACTATAVVGWCTAEYVGPTACGVGIATAPGHRRAGIATAAATCFLGEARRRGLTAYWECGQSNVASAGLAEKLGLSRLAAEHYWAGCFTG
jgi:hypothetical protein